MHSKNLRELDMDSEKRSFIEETNEHDGISLNLQDFRCVATREAAALLQHVRGLQKSKRCATSRDETYQLESGNADQ